MRVLRRNVRRFLLAALFFAAGSVAVRAAQQPASKPPAAPPAAPASTTAVVWVNTASGFYHQPGSRHYGKTKHGKYMSEGDAIRAGYRPAQN